MSKIGDQRRADILRAALSEFSLRGIDGVSMSEIAARVGIGKSTIYEYFPSKTGLFVASCRATIQRLGEQFQSIFMQEIPFSRQFELYVEMMLELAQGIDFNEVLRMFTDGSLKELKSVIEELGADVTAMVERSIRRAQATGELVSDLDVDITVAYLLSLPNPHLIFRLRQLGREDPVKAVVRLALRGIRAEDSQKDAWRRETVQ